MTRHFAGKPAGRKRFMTPAAFTQPGDDPFLAMHLPGSSPAMKSLRQQVLRLNSSEHSDLVRVILVLGESGAGKNHLAQVIAGHRRWLEIRDTDSFLGLDAGLEPLKDKYGEIHLPSLSDDLAESELFGHVKGAFTNATVAKRGLLSEAKLSDILLDEFGDISPLLQTKLLAIIDHGRFRPVGGTWDDTGSTSARMMLATNRNLAEFVRSGRFREDLYWRAMEFTVTVPPLREQPENIPAIVSHVYMSLTELRHERMTEPPKLSPNDLEWATTYKWPGNVRELKHALKRWLFVGGNRSLSEIVGTQPGELFFTNQNMPSLPDMVEKRINAILNGDVPSPGGPGELVNSFTREVKIAVHGWYRQQPRGNDLLQTLFTEGEITSIRNKMSEWGQLKRGGGS